MLRTPIQLGARALQCWLLGWLTIRPTVWLAAGAGRKLMGDARKTLKKTAAAAERGKEGRCMREREKRGGHETKKKRLYDGDLNEGC
jgi:hypothetical protein